MSIVAKLKRVLDSEHVPYEVRSHRQAFTASGVAKAEHVPGAEVAKDNGAMDFIANATGSIFAQGWTPELQKLVGGKQDAAGLLKAVQAEYEKELAR